MLCPVCNIELNMTERKGIEVDYCPKCRGVWLDRGELDKIIERSLVEDAPQAAAAPPPPRQRDDDHYRANYGKQRRRKSFLGDLFDFD